ncbi:MAG: NAD(P)/FAD-dependent oxidoreductase [Desulfobulbaceae bacterium]|jgi:phytoene dehydrogenase-like protein|nr:NAD(P)/FAD-dependent oxidoreductase [Desulfobulbaceae bacterium]
MTTHDYDALIIGAGLGGLTTAALLAKQGLRVCILEKNQHLGGYAVNYESHGHRFDVATQALGGCGEGGIIQNILGELELLDRIRFLPCEPARLYHFPDDDDPFIQHGFLHAQRDMLCAMYPGFADEIHACYKVFGDIFAELQEIGAASGNPVFGFSRNFPTLARYSRFTVQEFFAELQLPQGLQVRIGARSGYCMLPLSKLSLVAFACTEMSYAGGAWMVAGGVSRLVDLLASFIENHRGRVVKRCRVGKLLFDGGEVVGVQTSQGETLKAARTILAADAQAILARSGAGCGPLLAKYQTMTRSGSYLVGYYQVPAHCVQDMQANIEVRLAAQALAGKRKIEVYYLLIPSLVDKTSAPEGFHSLCISLPLADESAPDKHARHLLREALEQLVVARYPRLKDNLKFLFELGPEHFSLMTGNTNGSAYGWAQTVGQSGIHRLGNNPRINGLYLAGHWTMPGGGIAGVMTSGKLCAQTVLAGG